MTDPAEYVRQVETYLCRKNGGHLVRVVGPAFELVCGWASNGVPLKVAFRGIDRCCERREAARTSRRPLRIEFCEADVLDAFDEWRRAIGVTRAAEPGDAEPAPRKPALAAHIERAIARLAHARGVGPPTSRFHVQLERTIRELEGLAASAPRVRGEARARTIAELGRLDEELMTAATAHLDAARAAALRKEADDELAPFGARMPADVRERAARAAFLRLVRESLALPTLAYE